MDVSDIFYFFLLGGGEGGSPRRREGKGAIFYGKSQEGGGFSRVGGAGGEGASRVFAGNLGGGEGGAAKYFVSGPKCPRSLVMI